MIISSEVFARTEIHFKGTLSVKYLTFKSRQETESTFLYSANLSRPFSQRSIGRGPGWIRFISCEFLISNIFCNRKLELAL